MRSEMAKLAIPKANPVPGRANVFEVDLGAIRHNVQALRARVGKQVLIFAALKSDAYGFGLLQAAQTVLDAGVDGMAVVDLRDAVRLREAGVKLPMHLFGGMQIDDKVAQYICDYDLMPTLLRVEDADTLSRAASRPIKAFVKIDVGLERFGISEKAILAFCQAVTSRKNVQVFGLSTHFHVPRKSGAEVSAYVARQFDKFSLAIERAESVVGPLPIKMGVSSASLLVSNRMNLNAIDPGHLIFGLHPGGPELEPIDLRPAMASLKSSIAHVHVVTRTDDIAMSPFPLRPNMRVGVLPIGLADGMQSLHAGFILVGGVRCPVLEISLEHTRIDLADAEASVGTEAVIVGSQEGQEVTIADVLAHQKLRIPASVPLAVNGTVERRYIGANEGR